MFEAIKNKAKAHSKEMDEIDEEEETEGWNDTNLDDIPDNLKSKDETDLTKKGFGKGKGLLETELETVMRPYQQIGFNGVVSELNEIKDLSSNYVSAIIHIPHDEQPNPGIVEGHYVAIFIDTDCDMSAEYYDPFGEPMPAKLKNQLKQLIKRMNPSSMLKLKINGVTNQAAQSSNCAWHCVRFLLDRYRGKSFKEATDFSITEAEALENKKKKVFGYV